MIEGIEIIKQIEITKPPIWTTILGIFLIFITVISYLIFEYKDYENYTNTPYKLIVLVIGTVLIFYTGLMGKYVFPVHTGKYEYTVKLNNNLNWAEFNEKYEILEVEGDVYTIKLKEVD